MCRQVAQSSRENFEHVQKFYATKFLAKWSQSHRGCLEPVEKIPRKMVAKSSRVSRTRRELVADPSQFSRNHFGT